MNDEEPIWIVDDPRFDSHQARGAHPERPERLAAARQGLFGGLPAEGWSRIETVAADDRLLSLVHDEGYVNSLHSALQGWGHLDADTFFSPETETATWLAAGSAAALTGQLIAENSGRGVALLRPPGHHARPRTAMGFCILNNIAVAAVAALNAGLSRVAIVDWDVHHGNGTQEIFETDPRVLFVSLHQYPHYPGTGAVTEVGRGAGRGTTINIPLPAGCSPAEYGDAFTRIVLPALRRFDPELVLVSAGFDAHARDPLAQLELDDATFGAMTSALCAEHSRVGLLLEGGYDLQALEGSLHAVGRALGGETMPLPQCAMRPEGARAIEEALAVQEEVGAVPQV